MKKSEVKIGGLYVAKVSDKLVNVRIDSAHSKGGWNATNTRTGKRIRIKSAQRLRGAADGGGKKAEAAKADDGKDGKAKAPAKAAATKTKKSSAKKPVATKTGKEKKPKRVSALAAAAQVLAKAGTAMRAKELIAAMAEQGLWKSPGGKTPHATLYAAMLREIGAKGGAARFTKVDRGMFAFNGKAK